MEIEIHQLQASVRLGCTEEERAYPQVVCFDVSLELCASESLSSDKLEDTVDYMQVIGVIKNICMEGEFALLEHLVGTSGKEVLALSSKVKSVTIQAMKQIAPETKGISFRATFESEVE